MLYKIVIACVLCVVVYCEDLCTFCDNVDDNPVCGSDGITYASLCKLIRIECQEGKEIGLKCNGTCPCNESDEFSEIDSITVEKLMNLRKEIELETEEDVSNGSDDVMTLEVLDNQNDIILEEEDEEVLENSSNCPSKEMAELPRRLIDWFHVLKTNERAEKRALGIAKGAVLIEMKFTEAKLKAMYSRLSCGDNTDEVESALCLPSVKWMFYHLDGQQGEGYGKGDGSLSAVELYDIEEISNEYCIKPFLKKCDSNGDGKVILKEFCRCLCLTPPCTASLESIPTVLLNGKPRPFPGFFTPKCDEDGFYMPTQQNKRRKQYWCVDRNGAEIAGTRAAKKKNCHINTKMTQKALKLIPMDIEKENEAIIPMDIEKENEAI